MTQGHGTTAHDGALRPDTMLGKISNIFKIFCFFEKQTSKWGEENGAQSPPRGGTEEKIKK